MFRLAVDQNYKAATRDLARYYYSLETEEDNRKALDYYLQYIEYNPKDTDTLLHIGLIYESGLGVPLNIDLARRYYERAAEQDETGMAYNFLGGTYMNDEETENNERKAVHYFQKLSNWATRMQCSESATTSTTVKEDYRSTYLGKSNCSPKPPNAGTIKPRIGWDYYSKITKVEWLKISNYPSNTSN